LIHSIELLPPFLCTATQLECHGNNGLAGKTALYFINPQPHRCKGRLDGIGGAYNPEVAGSNPAPATKELQALRMFSECLFSLMAADVTIR